MERAELIRRITAGEEYLKQTGLNADQVTAAYSKLAKYREALKEMDAVPVEEEARIKTSIESIRALLTPLQTNLRRMNEDEN